jgi:hypothetical protein
MQLPGFPSPLLTGDHGGSHNLVIGAGNRFTRSASVAWSSESETPSQLWQPPSALVLLTPPAAISPVSGTSLDIGFTRSLLSAMVFVRSPPFREKILSPDFSAWSKNRCPDAQAEP